MNFFRIKKTLFNHSEGADYSRDLLQSVILEDLPSQIIIAAAKKKVLYENFSRLDFCNWGSIMASSMQEEIATQCFYIAYLMNIEKMGYNAELPFSTYNEQGSFEAE